MNKIGFEEYLPSNFDIYSPNRVWFEILVGVYQSWSFTANTLDTEKFMNFVRKILDEREKHIISKRNLSVGIDKRIADLFSSSQMMSG